MVVRPPRGVVPGHDGVFVLVSNFGGVGVSDEVRVLPSQGRSMFGPSV